MYFDGRTQGKGRVGEEGAVLTMISLISSDAVLNLCVHISAGKHFTTEDAGLQIEAKIKSLHT